MKVLKFISLIALFFIIGVFLNTFQLKTYAVESLDDIINGGDDFIISADSENIDEDKMKATSDTVYTVLFSLGIIAAVIIATILGVQYILAGADSKAKIKESMIPFVIGCIVLFSAFAIWKAVVLALK